MAIVPYTSTNQAGTTIFFQRHSQSGEGDASNDAVTGVVGLVDSGGNEIGSSNPLPISLPVMRVFSAAFTLDTSAYSSGNVFADILEITESVISAAGTGTIQSITIIDADNQSQPFDIIVFNQSVAVGTKNTAWAVSDTDMANALGIARIESADYVGLGSNSIATVQGLSIGIQPNSGTSVYLGTISRGTGTYTANGLRVVMSILRDG